MFLRIFTVIICFLSLLGPAFATCATPNKVPISAALPNYSFWVPVASAMRECGNVTINIVSDLAGIGVSRLQGQDKPENLLGVTTSNFDILLKRNAFRPLDDLVKLFGSNLHERQLVRVDGKVVAIAIAANTENFLYHEDLFKQEKISAPETLDDLIAAAQKLATVKAIRKPLALAYKDGWNVANSFISLHLSGGGVLLDDNEKPLVNTKKGIFALNKMKQLVQFIPENFETTGPAAVQQLLLNGEVGMTVMWASNLAALDNAAISRVSGRMKILPVPSLSPTGKPASTLWWDGFGISISSTNEEAEAAFKVAMEGLDEELVETQKNAAVWLMKSYKPGRLAKGVIAAIEKGIPRYPASETVEMLHTAMGVELPKFLKGEKSAPQVLADIERAYLAAARERGLVN